MRAPNRIVDAPIWSTPAVDPRRFSLQRVLGRGSTGIVFQAWDRTRHRHVAVKELIARGDEARALSQHEYASLRAVRHPNLLRAYELLEGRHEAALVLEYLEGRDFLQYVGARIASEAASSSCASLDTAITSPMGVGSDGNWQAMPIDEHSLERLRSATCQLAHGLQALHASGLIHRDLKPSNVIVTDEGRLVVIDFSLARSQATPTLCGQTIAGTASYIAPEVWNGHPGCEASDWYAVGVMLYQALTGHSPFRGAAEALSRVVTDFSAPSLRGNSDAPPELAQLVDALLERDPKSRADGSDILLILSETQPSSQSPTSKEATR